MKNKPDLDELITDLGKLLEHYKDFRSKYEKAILKPIGEGYHGSLIELMYDEYNPEDYGELIYRLNSFYWLEWEK